MELVAPELAEGSVADVIVLVGTSASEPTVSERLAAIQRLRANVHITDEQAATRAEFIRLERLAWQLPGDGPA